MFKFDDFFGKKILKSSIIDNAFFTTRDFVLHPGTLENLDDTCAENRAFLKKNLGVSNLYTAKQVHGTNVVIAHSNEEIYENCDGIVLSEPSSACFLNFADCIPLILYDKKLDIGAVLHAGWRGTVANIASVGVRKLVSLGTSPKNISAVIGPGIGKCCFETGIDVAEKTLEVLAGNSDFIDFKDKNVKFCIDLKKVNEILLRKEGVTDIDVSDYCTSCKNGVFFSYRRENKNTARHSAVLRLKRDL